MVNREERKVNKSIHDLIPLYRSIKIFICESMRVGGGVENFGKKRHEGVPGGVLQFESIKLQ